MLKKWVALSSVLFFFISPHVKVCAAKTPGDQTVPAKQASPFVLPIAKRDSLLNGLQLIVVEQPGKGTVTARLRINSGAMFDLAGKGGLADLTAEMILKGGGGLSAKNVSDTVEQLGMTLSFMVGWDTTEFIISGPADTIDSIFDLFNRAILTPLFDQKEFDALKARRIASFKSQPADDAELVRGKAIEAAFGAHPFGRPARGTAETIGQVARADLTYYHKRFYIANNAELLVTGDTTNEQVTRLARARMGSWKKGDLVPAAFRPPEISGAARVLILDRPESPTARAAIIQIGPSRRSDDYFAALIMREVFNDAASKIASTSPGTTIETEIEPRLLPSPFIVKIKTQASDLPLMIQSTLEGMSRLQSNEPGVEQVEAAKARLISAMAERLKTAEGIAEIILDIETYGLGRDYLIKYAERVNAVTPTDAQRAAQTYFKPGTAITAIAGPAGKLEEPAKKLGAVTILR